MNIFGFFSYLTSIGNLDKIYWFPNIEKKVGPKYGTIINITIQILGYKADDDMKPFQISTRGYYCQKNVQKQVECRKLLQSER